MKLIKNIFLNSTAMPSALTVKTFTVVGDPGAVFSMTVTNKDANYYNFSENLDKNGDLITDVAFAAAGSRLAFKTIDESGSYTGTIEFPAVSDDDQYQIILYAEGIYDTAIDKTLSINNIYILPVLYQYNDTTVTFSLSSGSSSSSYNTLPSAVTSVGISSSVIGLNINPKKLSISWPLTLSESQFIIARQLLDTDFQFTTTKITKTAGSSSKILELKDVSGLSMGMAVSGTGIASGSVIVAINKGFIDTNKSSDLQDVYSIPLALNTNADGIVTAGNSTGGTVTIDKDSAFVVDRVLTFTGKGSISSESFNNTSFEITNAVLTIDPVVTTLDAAASTTTIPLTSTDGIKAADTVLMTGIGVTSTSPHVDTVNNGVSVVVSAAQTIENGQTITFTGSSRSATITANVKVLEYGTDDITLTLALDNILTVA